MARKFKLPIEPGTTPKNVRFPNDIIKQVEAVTKDTKISFSKFVIEATRAALEDLDDKADETKIAY